LLFRFPWVFLCPRVEFFFSTSSRPALGSTKPRIQRIEGVLSPGVKRSEHEADESVPASAEVKKMWIHTFIPPYTLSTGTTLPFRNVW
jgi:hypothetical protein